MTVSFPDFFVCICFGVSVCPYVGESILNCVFAFCLKSNHASAWGVDSARGRPINWLGRKIHVTKMNEK